MIGKRDEADNARRPGPHAGSAVAGARTPEELETLLEDALLLRDGATLAALFEGGAVLVADGGSPIRGGEAIANLALALWAGDRSYVAEPQRVVQARDLALIVAERAVSVVRRERDGTWRYIIAAVSLGEATAKEGTWRTGDTAP